MADKTAIEWTRGDDGTPGATWNFISGCTKVSDGCLHCYIERTPPFRMAGRRFDHAGVGGATGIVIDDAKLRLPLSWRRPRRVFVNSLADLFHEEVPDDLIAHAFAIMAGTPRHTYQILTKRPARMRSLLSSPNFQRKTEPWRVFGDDVVPEPGWPLPNVWLGVSVETQQWADIRIPILHGTPAAVRWLSCEPLLGEVSLYRHLYPAACSGGCGCRWPDDADRHECGCGGPCGDGMPGADPGIHWVVAGGESGPGARPMHPDWARTLQYQCQDADVPFFFKQWGNWRPGYDPASISVDLNVTKRATARWVLPDGSIDTTGNRPKIPGAAPMVRVGKKAAGRGLDGRTWDEYPHAVPAVLA